MMKSKRQKEKHPGKSRPVIVIADGWSAIFPTITEASKSLAIDRNSLCHELKNHNDDGIEIWTPKYGYVAIDYAAEGDEA